MADFFYLEAINTDEESLIEESERVEERESDREFIDDTDYHESVSDYYDFANASRPYKEAIEDAIKDFDWSQDPKNDYDEPTRNPIDEFNNSEIRVEKFKSNLVNPQGENNPDSFFYSLLYTLRYGLTEKIQARADESELRSDVKDETYDELNQLKEKLKLDLGLLNFENQCFLINRIFMKNNLF